MNEDTLHPKSRSVKPPRRYDSPARRAQARETRRRIADAARERFITSGYVATTIADIAREAGVAQQTVYATFGTKREILHAVMDLAIGGDDAPVGVLERAGPQRLRQEPDQRAQLTMLARGVAGVLERAGPVFDVMRAAGGADAEIATAYDALQAERRTNMGRIVSWVAANGPLKPGLSVEAAGDVVWTLTSADVQRMLRRERGWSKDRYASWLADALIAALLP
jgi:AcrR family transcriptional regulator